MRLVIISDTHGYHDKVKIPDSDILIHCGDSTTYGEVWEMKKFLTWFGNQRAKYKIFINGNHEKVVWNLNYTKRMVEDHNKHFLTNIYYLEDAQIELAGLNFYGSPRTPQFFDWAYMYDRADGERIWSNIPDNIDVLITHGPPAGILDKVQPFGDYMRAKAGCDALLSRVKEIKPKVHCFGHIHGSYGVFEDDNTVFINAAICDESYNPINEPIVIDL